MLMLLNRRLKEYTISGLLTQPARRSQMDQEAGLGLLAGQHSGGLFYPGLRNPTSEEKKNEPID
jgi:hypothetical protein